MQSAISTCHAESDVTLTDIFKQGKHESKHESILFLFTIVLSSKIGRYVQFTESLCLFFYVHLPASTSPRPRPGGFTRIRLVNNRVIYSDICPRNEELVSYHSRDGAAFIAGNDRCTSVKSNLIQFGKGWKI